MTMRWMMALGMALVAGSAAAQDAPTLKSQKEKRSYALGISLGNSLRKQSIELDSGLLIQGLKDALSGSKTLLTEEEVRATLAAMQNEQREKQILAAKELAEKNKKEGEAFLAENKKKEGVVRPAERVTVQDRQSG